MSVNEVIPVLRTLSRADKFHVAQLLLEELAREEQTVEFKEGHVYPIWTPEFAPNAASQLSQVLHEENSRP